MDFKRAMNWINIFFYLDIRTTWRSTDSHTRDKYILDFVVDFELATINIINNTDNILSIY